jgi:hypothetical protein
MPYTPRDFRDSSSFPTALTRGKEICDTDKPEGQPSENSPKSGPADAAPQYPVGLREREGPSERSTGSGSGHDRELPRVQPSDDREGPNERSADRGRGSGFTKSSTSHEVRHFYEPQQTEGPAECSRLRVCGATTIRESDSASRATQRLLRQPGSGRTRKTERPAGGAGRTRRDQRNYKLLSCRQWRQANPKKKKAIESSNDH